MMKAHQVEYAKRTIHKHAQPNFIRQTHESRYTRKVGQRKGSGAVPDTVEFSGHTLPDARYPDWADRLTEEELIELCCNQDAYEMAIGTCGMSANDPSRSIVAVTTDEAAVNLFQFDTQGNVQDIQADMDRENLLLRAKAFQEQLQNKVLRHGKAHQKVHVVGREPIGDYELWHLRKKQKLEQDMENTYADYLGHAEPGTWLGDPFQVDEVWLRARSEKQRARAAEEERWQARQAALRMPQLDHTRDIRFKRDAHKWEPEKTLSEDEIYAQIICLNGVDPRKLMPLYTDPRQPLKNQLRVQDPEQGAAYVLDQVRCQPWTSYSTQAEVGKIVTEQEYRDMGQVVNQGEFEWEDEEAESKYMGQGSAGYGREGQYGVAAMVRGRECLYQSL